ncbi:MAG: hypothetical protein V2B18_10305 [Pseudomonadota bacterium]
MVAADTRARQLIIDIITGMDDETLSRKHHIHPSVVDQLREAVNRRSASSTAPIQGPEAELPKKKIIKVKEFLADFRERSDDLFLMEKYALKPKQLKNIYRSLIQKGRLSEYEYHTRDRKASELDEPSVSSGNSTQVNLIEDLSVATRNLYVPSSSRDRALGHGLKEQRHGTERRPGSPGKAADGSGGRTNGPEVRGSDYCPKCARPKEASSPEWCVYCGVVYSKVAKMRRDQGVIIWNGDEA